MKRFLVNDLNDKEEEVPQTKRHHTLVVTDLMEDTNSPTFHRLTIFDEPAFSIVTSFLCYDELVITSQLCKHAYHELMETPITAEILQKRISNPAGPLVTVDQCHHIIQQYTTNETITLETFGRYCNSHFYYPHNDPYRNERLDKLVMARYTNRGWLREFLSVGTLGFVIYKEFGTFLMSFTIEATEHRRVLSKLHKCYDEEKKNRLLIHQLQKLSLK